MNLSPTSRTLFLVQIGTFFSGIIVIACCCLYISAYPKSPEPGPVSPIASATLAFALLSTITTLILVLRQKSGRTVNATIEGVWVAFAALLWILAAIGGIAKPANGMTNVSCKVLPSDGRKNGGEDTDDPNFKRACQSMFASTAFCIVSALFFLATAGILVTFSIQRAVRDKKAAKVKVGGTYDLAPSPSQYRRANQNNEAPKTPGTTNAVAPSTPAQAEAGTSTLASETIGGGFSENVYQDPAVITVSTPAAAIATPAPAVMPVHSPYNTYASQPSYQTGTNNGGYDYNTHNGGSYLGGGGHVQQGSNMSNLSASAYDNNMYPQYQQQQQQPMQQQTYQQYPTMTTPMNQSTNPFLQGGPTPQQQYYMNPGQGQGQGQGQHTPIIAMPRPEYF